MDIPSSSAETAAASASASVDGDTKSSTATANIAVLKQNEQNLFSRIYKKFVQQKVSCKVDDDNPSKIQIIDYDGDDSSQSQLIENKICAKFIKMGTIGNVVTLFKECKSEWKKPSRSLKKCGSLLDQLKVALVNLVYLPTGKNTVSQLELTLVRDILELGAEYSVAAKDIPGFERYMSQLKCYYYDYKNLTDESQNMYQLLGLNLLFLLSQNRVAEFHTEVELLPADIIHTNKFIQPPLVLEQYLMEGSYNKIFQAKGNVPHESYNFFMDILLDTVRDEIGACLERAYEKISIPEGSKRLNLDREKDVKEFAAKRNWKLGTDNFYHFASETPKPKEPIPSLELAEQAIFYARELEMIV